MSWVMLCLELAGLYYSHLRRWVVFCPTLPGASGTSGAVTLELSKPVLSSLRTLPSLVSPPSAHDFVDLVVASFHQHFSRVIVTLFPVAASPFFCGSGAWSEPCSWSALGRPSRDCQCGVGALSCLRALGGHEVIHPALSPLLAGQVQPQLFERSAWCLKPGSPQAVHSFAVVLRCGSHCSRCWLWAQWWARQTWPLLPEAFIRVGETVHREISDKDNYRL